MGAAQHQGVHPRLPQGSQVLRRHGLNDHVAGAAASLLHQGDKQGAGQAVDRQRRVLPVKGPLIGPAADGGPGGRQAHPPVPAEGRRPPHRRLHHPHNGDVALRLERLQTIGAHGAAGHHHRLEIEGAQKAQILPGIFQEGLPRPVAVGDTGGISEVYNVLRGHELAEPPHRGQPPQS